MCEFIYNVLELIIAFIGALATFIIGYQANKISKSIEEHNREMEKIARRPFPVVDAIYPSKGSREENYEKHMRFYYKNMDKSELSLNGQVYVKALNPEILVDKVSFGKLFDATFRSLFGGGFTSRDYAGYFKGSCSSRLKEPHA